MTDQQKYTNRITNLVHLAALTYTLHKTALEEVKTGKDRPIHQATSGDLTTEKLTAAWKIAHDDVTKCVREIQARAWEQAIDTAYEHYLTEEQREHLHTTNPYKEN